MNKTPEQMSEEGIDWTPIEQSPSETAVVNVKLENGRTDTQWYNKDRDIIYSYDGENSPVTHWKYSDSHLHQRKNKTEFDKGYHSRDSEIEKLVEVLREITEHYKNLGLSNGVGNIEKAPWYIEAKEALKPYEK